MAEYKGIEGVVVWEDNEPKFSSEQVTLDLVRMIIDNPEVKGQIISPYEWDQEHKELEFPYPIILSLSSIVFRIERQDNAKRKKITVRICGKSFEHLYGVSQFKPKDRLYEILNKLLEKAKI